MKNPRPALFLGRHFQDKIIVLCLRGYLRVAGRWAYLYRAVDSEGNTIDFMLSPNRDLTAAKHFLQLALWRTREMKSSGELMPALS